MLISRQMQDKIRSQILRSTAKGAITMKTANEICPDCPANKALPTIGSGKVRNFCIKYQWNLDKLMKVSGKVPCAEKCNSDEAKALYAKHNRPVEKKPIKAGK